MDFRCEDLPQHGLILVPPSSPDYDVLLADIVRRQNQPVDGSPPYPEQFRPRIFPAERSTSAILLNRGAKTIAVLHLVWQIVTDTGRTYRQGRGVLSARSLLLPFHSRRPGDLKLYGYWHTILPGSKRYLGESGMVGDNTDVRPPAEDEKWLGGMVTGGGGGGGGRRELIREVTLVLDSVGFLDGEFAGPDSEKLFEQTVAEAEAHRLVGQLARSKHESGMPAAQILADIEKVIGPAPDRPPMPPGFRNPGAGPEDFRRAALQSIAFQLGMRGRHPQGGGSDEQVVFMLMNWADVAVPNLRKAP